MKAVEIVKKLVELNTLPWGVDVFFGRPLYVVAQDSGHDFCDVTHRFDPCKQYLVVWDTLKTGDILNSLGQYDLLIQGGSVKKYCWEIQ